MYFEVKYSICNNSRSCSDELIKIDSAEIKTENMEELKLLRQKSAEAFNKLHRYLPLGDAYALFPVDAKEYKKNWLPYYDATRAVDKCWAKIVSGILNCKPDEIVINFVSEIFN